MSDDAATTTTPVDAAATSAPADPDASAEMADEQDQPIQLPADHPLVKTLEAQKAEIKALKDKALRLGQTEEQQKVEAEKVTGKLAEVEAANSELTAENSRLKLAIEHHLSADDVELLEGVTDPDALKRLAARLAAQAATEGRRPRPDLNQGRSTKGAASNADLFAAAIGQHLK